MSEERVVSDLVWTPEQGLSAPEVRGIAWDNFLLSDEKYLGKWKTDSGVRVTPETALQSTVVLACCRILAETVSGLPIHVYRRNQDGSDEIAKEIPLYKILTFKPNEWQTKAEFFEQIMMNLTLWGNSYTRVRSGLYGSVSFLDNLHPSRMDVERLENGRLRYSYTDPETGRLERYTQDQIMHIRWTPEQDGIKGMVPVEIAREAIGLARACEQHAARFWANSARPGVVLQTDGTLTAEAAERLRDNWERLHRGSDRAYRTAILTGGLKAQELGMTNEASQFQSSRAFQTEEIGRVYRIPGHLIQGTPGGDLEVQGQEFVTYTLMPWLTRIESAISRSLIHNDDEYYAKFDVRGLLRGNSSARASFYSTMINLGVYTINDVRRSEGLKTLGPIGDHHFVPMNTQTLEDATKPKPEAPPGGGMPGMPGGGGGGPGGGDGPPPPVPGGPPSMSEVKTGKAPIASPKGEASKPKTEPQMEEAVEEASADWEDAIEGRAFCATGPGGGVKNDCGVSSVPANDESLKEKVDFVPISGGRNSDFAVPPTQDELTKALTGSNQSKGTKIGQAKGIEPGTPVALRIDIPAFNWSKENLGKSIYAVTIHESKGGKGFGSPISYEPIARLSGPVTFASKEKEAIKVATGESSKFPLATVKGQFDASQEVPSDIDSWTPVGYDPKKAAYFYDKKTGREVKGGTDAVSVGNTVFVRVPEYGDRHAQHQYRSLADSWGLESRALSPANQELYDAQEEIVEENGKWPQDDAHYMEKNPFASRGIKCSNCLYFEEGQCEIVQGTVSPEAICKLWIIPEEKMTSPEQRAFCPTGEGGGRDNSCGGNGGASAKMSPDRDGGGGSSGSTSDKQSKVKSSKRPKDYTPDTVPNVSFSVTEDGNAFLAARDKSSKPENFSELSRDVLDSSTKYLSADGKSGCLLTPDGDLGNVFNNGGPSGAGIAAVLRAIEDGAQTLDCYEDFLPRLYSQVGFVATAKMKWNDEYAPPNWDYNKNGRPDVIIMSYQGGDRSTIRQRVGSFKPYEELPDDKYTADFDAAKRTARLSSDPQRRSASVLRSRDREAGRGEGLRETRSHEGSDRVHQQPVEARDADCGRGPGGIFGPGNKCQADGDGSPSDAFGNPVNAKMRSPEGGGVAPPRVDSGWKKADGPQEYNAEQLRESPPARSLAGAKSVLIRDGRMLSTSLKETGVTLDQAVKVCGSVTPDANVTIAHGTLKEIVEYIADPSLIDEPRSSVTVVTHQEFAGVPDGVSTAASLTRTDDEALILSYNMFGVAPEVQKSSAISVAREMYKGVVKSITEAEKIGVEEVLMLAAGSDQDEKFKGYRIWPRLGFDGVIPRNRITPTYSLRLGFFEPYGSNIPDAILSPKAKAEKKAGALTVQSLYETNEGQRWWEENGGAMGMSLQVGNDRDPGWQRFKRISERVSGRDILEVLDIEWRAIRQEAESRGFCATGEGGGIDNSCGSGTATASVDNSWKKADREYLYEPGEGKSPIVGGDDIKSLSIDSPKEVASAMKAMKVKELTDVVAIGGGLTRGSLTSVWTSDGEIHVGSEVPVDQEDEEAGSMSSTVSLAFDEDGKKYVDYGTMVASTSTNASALEGSSAARASSILLEKFPESLAAAERAGFDYAKTFAMGDAGDEFKGYRLWPQFGFDGDIDADVRETIPKDIIPHDKPLTIQQLISTPAGKKWWNDNGSSMEMTLNLKDKKSDGYKRFQQAVALAARLRKRNEGRSLYDYLMSEERGFCATGEGGGIDNSCGGGGQKMAPDRDMGGTTSASPSQSNKPASVRIDSQERLDKAISSLGASGVDDVIALGGGNLRGANVAISADHDNDGSYIQVITTSPVERDGSSAEQFNTQVSIASGPDGKVMGFENLGLTAHGKMTKANEQKVMSLVAEKVSESIAAAERLNFDKITTFAIGDSRNGYKGYRLWPQFGFDGNVPRDLAKKVPAEIVLKSKGVEIPAPGSTSIPHDLVLKALASRHRNSLTLQELISTREGDRWWDENGDDVNLTLDLTDRQSLGYKRWEKMKARLPQLKKRNETREFFDALVEMRDADCGRTPDGKFGDNNKCQEDGDGDSAATATAEGGRVGEPASSSAKWKPGDAIPDAFEAVSAAKPVSRDESGNIVSDVFDKKDISPFAGQQFVSPIACGRYLAEMTARTRGEAIDSRKPLSEESFSFLVESMVQQVQSAESRGYTPAFYSDEERRSQIEAYSKIHPILRGGRTASGLCIGQEDEDGNCVQGDSITPEGEFLFRAVQAMTSPQASPLPNMQRADEVLTNFFENPDPNKAALGSGSVAGNAAKVAKANLSRLQKIIDKVGLTEAANIFSQPPVRAGDIDEFFEKQLGLKGFKAGGYSVDQVVPVFSVFGPKVGPFFANNTGDLEALTADVWFSRTWGRLTGELVQETNPKLATKHADVLSRRMRYVTDEDLGGTSREDFESSVEQMRKTGEIPASVEAWSEARAKRYQKEGFNKGVKGVRDKEVARLSVAIQNNLVSTLDDPGTTVRRSNMIDVISEVSRRTGHPPAFVQDLLWQDEQDIWAAAGARTSTDVGEASLYSTGINKMVADPMVRFPVKKAAEADKKKSKSSKARKRSIDVESRDYEDDIDSGRGWIEQLSFDMETEDVSPDEFADAFIEFAASLPRSNDPEDRSALESAANAVIERRSAGETTVVMPQAGTSGLHVMGFDAEIPSDLAETLPETLSHCKTLLDLHVSSEGRSWWEQNGREIDVSIDLNGVQGRVFDAFVAGKEFSDILEEGILDDYGEA